MADSHASKINLHELTSAVTAAVDHVVQHKAALASLKGPIIMGRVAPQQALQAGAATTDLHAVAKQITDGVNAKVHGLDAKPFVGPEILGFILNQV